MLQLAALAPWLLRPRWLAAEAAPRDDFFIFIHAGGGWDVTLWADPRNERRGLVEPATPRTLDTGGLVHWKSAGDSFEIVAPAGALRLGPAIGKLLDLRDRLTIVNGLAMNTVSHEDGTNFSVTGRHRVGGVAPESSIDALIASELGVAQMMPDISIKFPSAFVGDRLDRRAVPMRVDAIDSITQSLRRGNEYLDARDRSVIGALLADESADLSHGATHPAVYDRLASQQHALETLLGSDVARALTTAGLQAAHPQFEYRGLLGDLVVAAPFTVEAMRRNLVRCVSFGIGGFDTHTTNYRQHGMRLQELFGMLATLVTTLDAIPHPALRNTKLSERTHILVVSDFCRTPQINPGGGRDHYPNNSALVISPRFRAGVFGGTDPDQLLPVDTGLLGHEHRPIAPPDLLATFLAAFAIDPRRYMRDGAVARSLLV